MRILIAEDEKVARVMLRKTLLKMGHEVLIAEDGLSAWEIYQSELPDITITDWIMPYLDGVELCKKIRKAKKTRRYQFVIIVTSNDIESNRNVGFDAGADDFLKKPLHEIDLLVKLRACERIFHLQDQDRRLRQEIIESLKITKAKNKNLKETMAVLKATQDKLKIAFESANEATKAKSAFLANMSHELRTPLNAVIGYSEIVRDEVESHDLPDLVEDLDKIHNAGKRLLSVINDILDISKIEANKMELNIEYFSVNDLFDEIVAIIKPLTINQNNTLEVDNKTQSLVMHSDIIRIRQVLYNLLSNANKFTENGKIALSVEKQTIKEKDWVLIKVFDNGIGMDQQQTQKIFNAFTQADVSNTRKYSGTGLGLTISKRLCQIMGGDMGVESDVGKGSVFTISLPVSIEEQVDIQEDHEFDCKYSVTPYL